MEMLLEQVLVIVEEEKIQEVTVRERILTQAETEGKVCRNAVFIHFTWKRTCLGKFHKSLHLSILSI